MQLVPSHKRQKVILLHAKLSHDKTPNETKYIVLSDNFESCYISFHSFNVFKRVLLSRTSHTESLLVMQNTESHLQVSIKFSSILTKYW